MSSTPQFTVMARNPGWPGSAKVILPGILLCLVVTVIAHVGASWSLITDVVPLSPLTLGIVLGVLVRLSIPLPAALEPGIRWVLFWVLRAGIVLLGFSVLIQDMLSVGVSGLALVTLAVGSTLILAIVCGRWLQIPDTLSVLLGCGTGICGASAVVAANGVIRGREQDVACGIAAVTFFGTIAMFALPVMARSMGLSEPVYAVWAGSSVHEVAQAVGAGFAFDGQAGIDVSLYKLSRVALLAPICAVLAFWWQRRGAAQGDRDPGRQAAFPKFVLLFVLVVVINSVLPLSESLHDGLENLDSSLLAMAMVAMGLQTRLGAVLGLGWRPMGLALGLTLWISSLGLVGGLLIA